MNPVLIFDTTLRDGEQAPGFSMTGGQKLRLAKALEALKVDVMEAGFAAASPGDFDLLVHIEDTGGPSNLDTLCRQLERLYNVVSAEKVGRRKRAERA